jgi:hypothetical protein
MKCDTRSDISIAPAHQAEELKMTIKLAKISRFVNGVFGLESYLEHLQANDPAGAPTRDQAKKDYLEALALRLSR